MPPRLVISIIVKNLKGYSSYRIAIEVAKWVRGIFS